jgi:hypothetical protein
MASLCKKPHCFVPEDPCLMGEDDPKSCTFFRMDQATTTTDVVKEIVAPLPWGGNVFGVADLSYLASIARPRLVGLVGPQNAGKTTFLATLYLLLNAGNAVPGFRFARSLTLGGWEAIASNLRFDGKNMPAFPAHTTMREGRVPGLLHFGFRNSDDPLNDVVVSDSPGEWFRRWAIDEMASDAQGARWVAEKSDGFLIVLDSEALGGPNSGQTLNNYQQMLERLKKHARQRPVHIVWTKTDIDVPIDMRGRLESRLTALFPYATTSRVTVRGLDEDAVLKKTYLNIIGWMLGLNAASTKPVPHSRPLGDPFLMYR